jgi:hypothetical protein
LIENNLWIAGGNQIQIVNPITIATIRTVKTDVIPYEIYYEGKHVYLTHYDPTTRQQKGISIINPKTMKIKKYHY